MFSTTARKKRNKEAIKPLCNIIRKIGLFMHWKCFMEKEEYIKEFNKKEKAILSAVELKVKSEEKDLLIHTQQVQIVKYRTLIDDAKKLISNGEKEAGIAIIMEHIDEL